MPGCPIEDIDQADRVGQPSLSRRRGNDAKMILRKLLFGLTMVSLSIGSPVEALAQACPCSGTRQDDFNNGDGAPLDWLFHTYLKVTRQINSPPLMCYQKNVFNRSSISVVRVRWDVAAYYRQILPAGKDSPSCIDIWDEMKLTATSGRLFFGPGRSYDTDVRQPRKGWTRRQGVSELVQVASSFSEYPPLRSEFTIYTGENSLAQIQLISSAQSDEATNTFKFQMRNTGNATISLLANLFVGTAMLQGLPMVERPLELPPGGWKTFTVKSRGDVQMRSSTVVFFDKTGRHVLGADAAGFYGPANGRQVRPDENLWRNLQ